LVSAQASTGVPISFGVLTTDSIEQAIERSGTKAGNKGGEAAMTALVEGSERRGWARPRVDRVSFCLTGGLVFERELVFTSERRVDDSERRGWVRARVDRVSFASHEWARFYE